ncbi:MAG: hypothetical protein AAGK04_00845 [Planctomycetota bacterium]
MARSLLIVACLLFLVGCGSEADYAQSSPEELFESARLMVENEDYERLHELLWTDDPRERAVYLRMGQSLGAVGGLAEAVGEAFPKDVEALKRGEGAEGLLGSLLGGRRGAGGRGGGGRAFFRNVMSAMVSDPYGFLERSEGRLSAAVLSDTRAAVLWDGEGVLPPLGVLLREEGGFWYVEPPINSPLTLRYRPQSDEEFAILGYLFDCLTSAAEELEAEVRRGRYRSIEDLAQQAGRKSFVPVGMCFFAYMQALEARDQDGA